MPSQVPGRFSPDLYLHNSLVALVAIAVILALEAILLGVLYKNVIDFECRTTSIKGICQSVSLLPVRALAVIAVLGLFLAFKPTVRTAIVGALRPELGKRYAILHGVGIGLALLPAVILRDGIDVATFAAIVAVLLIAGALIVIGAVGAAWPPARLYEQLRLGGWPLLFGVIAGFLAPDFAQLLNGAWQWSIVTEWTFAATAMVLSLFGTPVADADARHLGLHAFVVMVADSCSGLEGIALVTIFAGFYVALFYRDLRLSRVWLLFPVIILASWSLNVVRIATLVLIGAYVSPDLAINGFHSHAGWVFFTISSLAFAALAHRVQWFRRATSAPAQTEEGFFDPVTGRILPFVLFAATGMILAAFTAHPGLYFWISALVMAGAIYLCRTALLVEEWSLDPLAIGVGVAVAALWITTASPAETAPAYAATLASYSPAVFALWIATRVVGTTILVPIVEELFFRKYLLSKFEGRGFSLLLVGILLTSAFFGALHQRWVIALIAGVAFAFVYLRRHHIADAIVAHGTANGIIAGAAALTGEWELV